MGFQKILKKMKAKEKEMRILILGLDNAGKSHAYDFSSVSLLFLKKLAEN